MSSSANAVGSEHLTLHRFLGTRDLGPKVAGRDVIGLSGVDFGHLIMGPEVRPSKYYLLAWTAVTPHGRPQGTSVSVVVRREWTTDSDDAPKSISSIQEPADNAAPGSPL